MSVCTTCFEPGIRNGRHNCPGPQSIIAHRDGDKITIVEAPPRGAISLQLLFEERAHITMPTPDTIDLAGQVVYRVVGYVDGTLALELMEDRLPPAVAS